MKFSRRLFLQISFGLSSALTLGGLLKYLAYQPDSSTTPTTFNLDKASAYVIGSASYIKEARAWLFRDEAGFFAISIICPHLGCSVERRAEDFLCPCHGSRFTSNGIVVNGPAAQNLNYLKLSLGSDGRLKLYTDKIVDPTERVKA